jgi:galactoside O-acetyltransferase
MTTTFYSEEELQNIGFKKVGSNVLISKKASIYTPEKISIGDNVRIDDFCILSGTITFGSHIHISPYAAIFGRLGVTFEDYSNLSARSSIYSAMDDISGDFLAGPVHPASSINVTGGEVRVSKYVSICANCIIFPNITLEEGVVVGAFSLVNKSLPAWGIYVGIPAKKLKDRTKGLLKFV